MASLLRQIVAGPRARHPEAGLDLCYVTDNIIATSGPSGTYPQVAYRNPLKDLVKFLDSKHGDQWAIWEFRAEGTGYPDSEVYNRVWHYPWPDHHPPPFALIPLIMGSMRNWLKDKDAQGRVVVVHCKAGKGRSGTISCSYLISEEGWTPEDAMQRFSERRMRPGFGVGISIPSQQRWIRYAHRWTRYGKKYVDRPIEVLELHVWGLRDGVKIVVEGYVEEGKTIKKFHTFKTSEREIVRGEVSGETGFSNVALEVMGRMKTVKKTPYPGEERKKESAVDGTQEEPVGSAMDDSATEGGDVVFRPSTRVVLPASDINMDFERRNKATLGGFTMVTSVAHVWFNTFFEGNGPENDGKPEDSGVFEMDWDAMDGIKGSSRKGIRAFDKFAVVWQAVDVERGPTVVVDEPAAGEEVPQTKPADWRGEEQEGLKKKLGLRPEKTDSASVSRASSVRSQQSVGGNDSADELVGVRSDVHDGTGQSDSAGLASTDATSFSQHSSGTHDASAHGQDQTDRPPRMQVDGVSEATSGMEHLSTAELPGGRREDDMKDHSDHFLGHMKMSKNVENSS